ncbi:hypothetical protein F4810DRAFT_674686 [Camillea tinctor]|nr:hypothetical protein F4810DRAFT_674686 [Camillea tinctor]
MTAQVLQRVSIRWLPDPAYEDTDTIALNVGGYFVDLRVVKADDSIQWSRAGERIVLKDDPLTCRWTRIIDSLRSYQVDEASFVKLPNGDNLEFGKYKNNEGLLCDYEEVWRDVTHIENPEAPSWITQSIDGSMFLGRVGDIFLGIHQYSGGFSARKERFNGNKWETLFVGGDMHTIPTATEVTDWNVSSKDFILGQYVNIAGTQYVVKGLN